MTLLNINIALLLRRFVKQLMFMVNDNTINTIPTSPFDLQAIKDKN